MPNSTTKFRAIIGYIKTYLLHSYEYGKEKEHTETKFLGIYSSAKKANEAIERYRHLQGFCDYPKKCFTVLGHDIDFDMWWNEGFIQV